MQKKQESFSNNLIYEKISSHSDVWRASVYFALEEHVKKSSMREISLIQIVSTSRVAFWHTLSASKCYKRFQSENYPESEWEKKSLNAKQQNKTVHYSEVS